MFDAIRRDVTAAMERDPAVRSRLGGAGSRGVALDKLTLTQLTTDPGFTSRSSAFERIASRSPWLLVTVAPSGSEIRTAPGSPASIVRTKSSRLSEWRIASTALRMRLMSTCWICARSTITSAASARKSNIVRIPASREPTSASAPASSTSFLRSSGFLSVSPRVTNSRR